MCGLRSCEMNTTMPTMNLKTMTMNSPRLMLTTSNLSHKSPRRRHRYSLASCADSVDSRGVWRRPLTEPKLGHSAKLPTDWHASTEQNIAASLRACEIADGLKRASLEAVKNTRQGNLDHYQNLDQRFGEKLSASKKLHALLGQRIKSVHAHVQRMRHLTASLQAAHHARRAPLELCNWRRQQRTERPAREKVRDVVETMLAEEHQTLTDAQGKIRAQIAKTAKMVETLQADDADLRADLTTKAEAISVDDHCREARHSTWPSPPARKKDAGAESVSGKEQDSENARVSETHRRLKHAEQSEQQSVSLEKESEELVAALEKKCLNARSKVEEALRRQIEKTKGMQEQLQQAVAKTSGRIEELARTIKLTREEQKSHDEPVGLVNSKQRWRNERPAREKIDDPVAAALKNHTGSLKKNLGLLTEHGQREQDHLAELKRVRESLTVDMAEKTAALMIDLDCQDSTTMADKTFFSFLHRKGSRSFMMR